MSVNFTKILGWVTFLVGISIIIFSLYFSYNIFTGKKAVPEFFKTPIPSKERAPGPVDPQKEIGRMIREQLKEMLPFDALTRTLNLAVWATLAGILIFGGAQISNLGIKLIKD